MSAGKLSNIALKDLRYFLKAVGCNEVQAGKGGHEKWTRRDLRRPIILQSHIDPVPEFIVKQILRHLNYTREDFFDILKDR
jgi:hypothetical protein